MLGLSYQCQMLLFTTHKGANDVGKKVVDAKQDSKGNITAVRLSGNSSFTPVQTAMNMADRGQIDNAHSVRPKSGANPTLELTQISLNETI